MWLTSDILLHRGQPRGIPMCARALAQNKSVRRKGLQQRSSVVLIAQYKSKGRSRFFKTTACPRP